MTPPRASGRAPSLPSVLTTVGAALLSSHAGPTPAAVGPATQAAGPGSSPVRSPTAEDAPVWALQGASHISPLRGKRVVTRGVVTAVTPEGLYLQDAEGDGRARTSDAVYVVPAPGSRPSAGDRLRITGTVREPVPGGPRTANLTVTTVRASRVEVLATGQPLPRPVSIGRGGRLPPTAKVIGDEELPVDLRDPEQARRTAFDPHTEALDFWESLEGMRVRVAEPVAVSPTYAHGEGTDVFTLAEGGAHVAPEGARTPRGALLLQPHPDNRGDRNPERIRIRFDHAVYPAPVPDLAVRDRLGDVTGVVGYGHGNFAVVATAEARVESADLEPETTELRATRRRVTVAVYNVLDMNPLPATGDRRARLGAQIARRLNAPDVLALQEIRVRGRAGRDEDGAGTGAAATLRAVTAAVVAAGGPRYEFAHVDPAPDSRNGAPGPSVRNAFLYDPERVSLVELRSLGPRALEAAGAPEPHAFRGARDPLAATFSFRGRRFTVLNNHFSSRSGSTPLFGALHPIEQAGEAEREAQSRAVHAWVESRLAADSAARIAVVGDFNTFEFTDDLTRLLPGEGADRVLWNLQRSVPAGDRYSYIYEGNAETLDHFFVTSTLRAGAELDVVHLNAEFPPAAGPEGVTSASDHEPLLGRLLLVR